MVSHGAYRELGVSLALAPHVSYLHLYRRDVCAGYLVTADPERSCMQVSCRQASKMRKSMHLNGMRLKRPANNIVPRQTRVIALTIHCISLAGHAICNIGRLDLRKSSHPESSLVTTSNCDNSFPFSSRTLTFSQRNSLS